MSLKRRFKNFPQEPSRLRVMENFKITSSLNNFGLEKRFNVFVSLKQLYIKYNKTKKTIKMKLDT